METMQSAFSIVALHGVCFAGRGTRQVENHMSICEAFAIQDQLAVRARKKEMETMHTHIAFWHCMQYALWTSVCFPNWRNV